MRSTKSYAIYSRLVDNLQYFLVLLALIGPVTIKRRSDLIIYKFWTGILILVAAITTFWPFCSLAFFRCLVSNLGNVMRIPVRKFLQPLSNRLPAVTNFYPTCHQLLVSMPASIKRTPLMLLQTKAIGPQQGSKVEEVLAQEKNPDVQVFDVTGELISTMKKDKAMKLAKSKELKLVELIELKSAKHPLSYQLMTGKQLFEIQQKERNVKKDKATKSEQKLLTLKGNISDHDMGIKMKKMKNSLEKDFDLKIIIRTFSSNEENNRKQQSNLLKKITEETANIATVKKASSTETEMILLLRKKILPT